jgi:hypothetical protein
MNKPNEDFTIEDILSGLYKLACGGSANVLNIDLIALEKLSSPLSADKLIVFARLGCETEDDKEFVRVCESVLVKEEA